MSTGIEATLNTWDTTQAHDTNQRRELAANTDNPRLGEKRPGEDRIKVYRWVELGPRGAAYANGQVLCVATANDDNPYLVTNDQSAWSGVPVGVLDIPTNGDTPDRGWKGWVQTYGQHDALAVTSGTFTVGQALKPTASATDDGDSIPITQTDGPQVLVGVVTKREQTAVEAVQANIMVAY